MHIDTARFQTADGYDYRVLATDLPGSEPVALYVNDELVRLNEALECRSNPAYSLVERQRSYTRYFNVYRAADGGFTFGSKAFHSDEDRRSTQDSQRALFGLCVRVTDSSLDFAHTV
jgi:hypothetical protein